MPNRFQFTVRNALIATTLLAIWFALVASVPTRIPNVRGALAIFMALSFVMGMLPAMALGALFGRPWFGALCGAASVGGLLLWSVLTH
jgi:hypothetical protein